MNNRFPGLILLAFLSLLVELYSQDSNSNSWKRNLNQKSELKLVNLYYENSSGEKGITKFYYDENGLNQKAKWELLDGTRNSLNYHTLDKNGRILIKYREFSDNITSTTTYIYDSLGNLTKEFFTRSDEVMGQVDYFYNEDRKLKKAYCKGLNGWFYGTIFYKYNLEDQKYSAIIFRDSIQIGEISYSYNDSGLITREFWDFPGKWNQTFNYKYSLLTFISPGFYTSSNVYITNAGKYKLTYESYDYSGESGGPSEFIYDSNNKLLEKVFTRSDGLKTITTYKYDKAGILTKSLRNYSNGLKASFSYIYDGNRRLIQRKMHRSDGLVGKEVYEYDKKGDLKSAVYENFDSWLSGKINYAYDSKGKIRIGIFEGKSGLNAEISFAMDDFGNIEKVHWDFSNGRTQTYTFKFEKIMND